MRAAVFHDRNDIRIEDLPVPEPGAGEALVRVEAVGICGTDAHEYTHGPFMFPIHERHPVTGHAGPMVPGHEVAGRIEMLGPGVDGFAVGDLVVSGAGISCGECLWCTRGRTNLCAEYASVGLQRHGGLAEFCSIPASTLMAADPFGLTPDAAALGQPMSIAVHAMRRGRLEPGQTAAIIGVGGIGAFLTYAAAAVGATVLASDLDADRLRVATVLGATRSIDPRVTSVAQVLRDVGLFPDVVYEVTGTAAGLRAAFDAADRGSRIVAVGLHGEHRQLDVRDLSLREVELIGTNAHVCSADLPEALRLIASRNDAWSDIAPIALSLDRLIADGLEPLAEGRPAHIKYLVDPSGGATRATRMRKRTR